MQFDDGKQDLYKEIFSSFDVDHNGFLSLRELRKCMKALDDPMSSKDLKFLIKCSDKDENGKMDCQEFCVMATIKNMVSIADLRELRDVFISFDLDNDGTINVKELGRCMEKLGEAMTKEECRELISSADKDEDGCMSFFEFVIMVKSEKAALGEDDQSMRDAFQMFDQNGDGHIDKTELAGVLAALDGTENPTDEELEAMFKEADADNDGKITFEEFQTIIN